MSKYSAKITWHRDEESFENNQYSRVHTWKFDGGLEVLASASPHIVPPPMSVAANIDPEEAFVASLSSCHMLWFLHLAQEKQLIVESYIDNAVGILSKNSEGRLSMTTVTLLPEIVFYGKIQPKKKDIEELHHQAHESCFIANSVKTKIIIEPV